MRKRTPKQLFFVARLASLSLLVPLGFAATAWADTSVTASVCGPEVRPTLVIDRPQSDSTVTTTSVEVAGSATLANQVLLYADGNYLETDAIPTGETAFHATISLEEGTHEVKAEAVNSYCSVTQKIVLTVNIEGSSAQPQTTTDAGGVTVQKTSYNGVIVSSADMTPFAVDNSSSGDVGQRLRLWFLTPLDAIRIQQGPNMMNIAAKSAAIALFLVSIVAATMGQVVVEYRVFGRIRPWRRWLPWLGIVGMALALVIAA